MTTRRSTLLPRGCLYPVHIIPCGRVSILFEQEMMVTTTMCNTGDVEIGFSREQPTYIIVNQEDQVVDGEADGSTTEAPSSSSATAVTAVVAAGGSWCQ
uniref:Uncharacterized protein n=1 Tax=Oryza barthii TaxID=65489 RepID=A0A0D3HW66_9ORYZ